jgi:hypothetical protein
MVMMVRALCTVRGMVLTAGVLTAAAVSVTSGTAFCAMGGAKNPSIIIPLAEPIRERSKPYVSGAVRGIVTVRGVEIADSDGESLDVKSVGVTETFTDNTPEIYVVVEFVPSPFDIFRLVARFILEDPSIQPEGILVHTVQAQFNDASRGGHFVVLMKQPPQGFPVGKYRVEIHDEDIANASLIARARFEVVASNVTPAPSLR